MKRTEKMLKSSNLKLNLNKKINQNPFVAIYKKKNENGITLIALVVTIVVLIILAVISINAVLGENGIIKRAETASQHQANAEASDNAAMDELAGYLANAMAGNGGTQTPTDPDEPVATGPNGKPLTSTVESTNHTGTEAEDALGNPVYIPGGFKIAEDSGSTVKEGIVIEDGSGNQFVWIPVSNIDGSQNNPIKIDANNSVVITLGRYTFANSSAEVPGAPSIVQKGSEWAETTSSINETYKIVDSYSSSYYHYELATKMSGKNEVVKDLEDFIDSVEEKHGYYLARYEASYASGSSTSDYKPASKVSTNKTTSSWTPSTAEGSSTAGYLWNYISQADASTVCQNMYAGDSYVESDLVNSYAWDTAIVYIQAMENSNYANQGIGSNTSLKNTGSTGDQKCKIFDMAGNVTEWTTEYCTTYLGPCTSRGGYYSNDSYYTANRGNYDVVNTFSIIGFRPLLYCKTGA